MNDDDIKKLAAQLSQSLATKDDLKTLATKNDLGQVEANLRSEIKGVEHHLTEVENNLRTEIKDAANGILKYVDEIDKSVVKLDKRVRKIESLPQIAH